MEQDSDCFRLRVAGGGVAGVLLRIIPGTPFLIAAVAVLGSDHPVIRPWKERVNRWIKKDRKSKEMNQ